MRNNTPMKNPVLKQNHAQTRTDLSLNTNYSFYGCINMWIGVLCKNKSKH